MGTTRIKVIDLSGQEQQVKTSRKHAEKLSGLGKLKEEKKAKETKVAQAQQTPPATEAPAVEQAAAKEQTGTVPVSKSPKPPTVAQKTIHHKGKKYQQAQNLVDKNKTYEISEALDLLAKTSYTKFDPTVEIQIKVTDRNLRGSVNFPHAVGQKRERRYLIFSDQKTIIGSTEIEQKAQKSTRSVSSKTSVPSVITNNIIWGNESIIADIETGKLKPGRDFDTVIASPKFMPSLARVAKILGPAGVMPNPKNGTISDNPVDFIKKKAGGVEFKTDPTAPIIHTTLGKLSAKPNQLEENLQALIKTVGVNKIKKATLKSTMSPPVKLDLASIAAS